MKIYEIPNNITELFQEKDYNYRIIDHDPEMEMDNNQSMQFFLEQINVNPDNILEDNGTLVKLTHDDFDYGITIESSGLGDFFSHGFDVYITEIEESCMKDENKTCNRCIGCGHGKMNWNYFYFTLDFIKVWLYIIVECLILLKESKTWKMLKIILIKNY